MRTVVAGVLFAGMGAGAGWYYTNQTAQAGQTDVTGATPAKTIIAAAPVAPSPDPIYLELEPFTVAVGSHMGNRALYVGFTLQVRDVPTQNRIQKHLPELRSRILMELADQSPDHLASKAGREGLLKAVAKVSSTPFSLEVQDQTITNVLLTAFVIQ